MNVELFNNTKLAAYFIWEYTEDDNALNLWHCAEDIACCFESLGLLTSGDVMSILSRGKFDFDYIHLLRHMAFRLFIYTKRADEHRNWFEAERLLRNGEWLTAIITNANIYANNKKNINGLGIRNNAVKDYYLNN